MKIRTGRLAVLTALIAIVPAAPAAAIDKPYSVNLSPASVPGGAPATITVTITNNDTTQRLGSANITAPSQLPLSAVGYSGTGTATKSGQTIQLRSIELAPGASRAVTANVGTPSSCTGATYAWTTRAKQSNDFRGTNNDFMLDASRSSLTTTVVGGCTLRFARQPASAEAGDKITGEAHNPAGAPVAVEVLGPNGERQTSASDSITMSLGANPADGTLSGTLTVQASNGLASFTNLVIDKTGVGYKLKAVSGSQSTTSNAFDVDQSATRCNEDQQCSSTLSGTTADVTITAYPDPANPDEATLTMSFNTGPDMSCQTQSANGDRVTYFVSSPFRSKLIRYTLRRGLLDIDKFTLQQASFCYGMPEPFPVAPGTTLYARDYDSNGSIDEYVGQLPDCPSPGGPCISARQQNLIGDIVIDVTVPPSPVDPRGYGLVLV